MHPFITRQRFVGPFQPPPDPQLPTPAPSKLPLLQPSQIAAALATSPEAHAQVRAAAEPRLCTAAEFVAAAKQQTRTLTAPPEQLTSACGMFLAATAPAGCLKHFSSSQSCWLTAGCAAPAGTRGCHGSSAGALLATQLLWRWHTGAVHPAGACAPLISAQTSVS